MTDLIRQQPAAPVLTDRCPGRCASMPGRMPLPVRPWRVVDGGAEWVASYTCTACGHRWSSGWAKDIVDAAGAA